MLKAAASRPTAVFLGDSITQGWARSDPAFFASNGLVGRGISGQVTGQTLLRFQQDVVGLHPKVVHFMIGTNDVAGNAGPTTYGDIERNLIAMIQLGRGNGILVVLATVPPAADVPWRRGKAPAQKITQLNSWIRDYAGREPSARPARSFSVLAKSTNCPTTRPVALARLEIGSDRQSSVGSKRSRTNDWVHRCVCIGSISTS